MDEDCLGCRGGSVHHTCGREPDARNRLWLCRACHFGHFNECEDERCQSMRLEDRHE